MGRVRIKICGLTRVHDAEQAVHFGADAVGLNLYSRSPRCISEATAKDIIRALPPFVEPVGLFVNRTTVEIAAWANEFELLHTFQMHGDHQELPPDAPIKWIPAFSVRDAQSLPQIDEYLRRCREHGRFPHAIMVDAHVAGEYGGTGKTAPWHLLTDYKPEVPLILAGGLNPDNVAEAIRIVRPYAVDVASGVEESPGKKHSETMRRFIDQVFEASD